MIKSLRIKNFKSIATEQLVSLGQFTVIVGNNGVGKSNLINSITLIKDVAAGVEIENAVGKMVFTHGELFNRNSSSTETELEISLVNGDEREYRYVLRIALVPRHAETLRLVISYEKLVAHSEKGEVEIFTRQDGELVDNAGKKIPLALSENITAISQYKNPESLKVKDMLSKCYTPSLDMSDLVQKVEDLVYKISKRPEKYEKLMIMSKRLLPHLNSFEQVSFPKTSPILEQQDEYLVLFTEKNMKGRLSFRAISHGDLRTIYYLVAGILSDNHATFIFDEIENGIHPDRVCKIVDFLSNISHSANKQFIFSTHSSGIINHVAPQNVIYVGKDANRGTIFTPLSSANEITAASNVLNSGGDLTEYLHARFAK